MVNPAENADVVLDPVPGTALQSADPQRYDARRAALRADLTAAAYTLDGIAALLGPVASAALHREEPLAAERRCREAPGPPATLVRLFALGGRVASADLATALPACGVDGAVDLGLVVREGDDVRATCDLRPYGDEAHLWWVASDLGEYALGSALPVDHVIGIGGASTTLAAWTPRPRVGRALDLGTGSGVQALHLAGHAHEVVATDLSERALEYARFTAALNGLDVDLRHGSLLDPVAGERFDLVVCNPPFVITPRDPDVPVYTYRDGGRRGDALTWELLAGLPAVLAPGGLATFLLNWETAAGEDWEQPWRDHLEGTGLDAWIVRREATDPAEYAETWARDGGAKSGSPQFRALCEAWLHDFAARGVETIHFGVVTLQRPASDREPWASYSDARGSVAQPMGPHVLAGVRARTWLAERDDDAVLDVAWRCADDVTEERTGRPGATDPSVILLRQGGGLRRTVRLSTVGAALVGVCDGDLTAAAAATAIAVILGEDGAAVRTEVTGLVRDLVADGFLVADGAGAG